MHLNVTCEPALLQGLTTPQLRQRFAETFGEATDANNRDGLVKPIPWRLQARAPLDRCCRRLNLGLYDSLHEARKAIKLWVATGKRPPGVLPKYVRRSRGGRFVAAIPTPGAKARLGPFDTAEEASRAAEEHIRRMLGSGRRGTWRGGADGGSALA